MVSLRTVNEAAQWAKKVEMMEKCYECYAEHGLSGVGIKAIADACGCNSASLYQYFDNLDDLIVKSAAYTMDAVEQDLLKRVPKNLEDLERFIEEVPFWVAKNHGKRYRLMYQIYTHPKYIEHGKAFFEGVNLRYTEYAKKMEKEVGIPHEILAPMLFMLLRGCVHYAMFENEPYLRMQLNFLKQSIELFAKEYAK